MMSSVRDEEFIDIPDIVQTVLVIAELSSVIGSELLAPVSNRLIRDGDTALGKEIFDITEAELEAMV
jgi:hypothetical protein